MEFTIRAAGPHGRRAAGVLPRPGRHGARAALRPAASTTGRARQLARASARRCRRRASRRGSRTSRSRSSGRREDGVIGELDVDDMLITFVAGPVPLELLQLPRTASCCPGRRQPPGGAGMKFPDGFQWGVATASYQIEGAVEEDGRAPSIWDTFSHTPGRDADGDTGDVADDHYHRWPDDLGLLATRRRPLPLLARLAAAAARAGAGALNEAGVDFYSRLVDGLLERGVQPWITLYHWDLPQALAGRGRLAGARDRRALRRVRRARARAARTACASGRRSTSRSARRSSGTRGAGTRRASRTTRRALAAAHHLLLGHGLAVGAMRAQDGDAPVGLTLNLTPTDPASDDPADVDAARRIDGDRQPPVPRPGAARPLPRRRPRLGARRSHAGRRRARSSPRRSTCSASTTTSASCPRGRRRQRRRGRRRGSARDVEFVRRGLPRTEMGWEIDAGGLYDMLTRVRRDYPPVPLYVTENGAAFPDEVDRRARRGPATGSPTSTRTSAPPRRPSPTASTCAATSCGR